MYGLVAAVGSIPVAVAVCEGARFGTEATIGLMMLIVGVVGLVSQLRTKLPAEPE